MRTAWAIIAAILASTTSALASTTLYPEPSGRGAMSAGAALADRRAEVDYMTVIAAGMPEGFGPQVRVRLIQDRTNRETALVALVESGTAYQIVSAQSASWLKIYPHAQVSRCAVTVEPKMAQDIIAAWKNVLLSTSYAERPDLGAVGDVDHFAMSLEGRWLGGWVYSPPVSTPPGRLEALAMAMRGVCIRNENQERQRLKTILGEIAQN